MSSRATLVPMENSFEIIAHRGASWDAPENTLPAFELAWHHGADAVECDIRLSSDGRIMVHHDASTLRTTGSDRMLAQTHSRTLRGFDAARNASPLYTGSRIPYLREVLETVPEGKRIYIEIKCGVEILPALRRQLSGESPSHTILIGFDSATMAEAKQAFPEYRVLWLYQRSLLSRVRGDTRDLDEAVRLAESFSLDGFDVRRRDLTEEFASDILSAGLDLCVWTVNDPVKAEQLISWGVSGITTDRPGWLREGLVKKPR